MKNFLPLLLLFGACFFANAQPGCPAVSTNHNVLLPCGKNCTNLTATAFSAAQTTTYSIDQITYNPPTPFNTGTPILVNIDDRWSNIINLPFNFCFFGVSYNRIILGSNGVVSFNTTNAGTTNNWQIPDSLPSITPTDMRNTIMGAWQDLDPTFRGYTYYQISGTAPCRKFVVSWYQVPYYGDINSFSPGYCQNQALFATQQIVLYETTNAVETYIQSKRVCSDWNGGKAVHGIQNAAGTVAFIVPGRNGTQWTATNDAWRFTPNGAPNFSIAWFDKAGTQVGAGSTVQFCSDTTTTLTVRATYTNCDNSNITVEDTVRLTVKSPFDTLKANLSFNPFVCYEAPSGVASVGITGGPAPYTYSWSNQSDSSSAVNLPAGSFSVTISDGFQCTASATGSLTRSTQIWYTSILDLHLCSDPAYGNLEIVDTGGVGGPGSRTYYLAGIDTNKTGKFQNVPSGTHNFFIMDSVGCTGSGTITIPESAANDSFTITTDSVSCFGYNDGTIVITPEENSVYQYSIDGGTNWQSDNTFTNIAAGHYDIAIKNLVFGCLYNRTTDVGAPKQKFANAKPDTIVTAPNTAQPITVNTSNFNNPVYNWSPVEGIACATCDSTTLSATQFTVYYVSVSEGENTNCIVVDSIIVVVTNGYAMPDAFTPNNDNKNDLFGPVSSGTFTVAAFRIYNRWGQMVHNSTSNWDGRFGGKEQAIGTYSYYIEVEIPDAEYPGQTKINNRQGSVTLLR